jgi:hypothetical protein
MQTNRVLLLLLSAGLCWIAEAQTRTPFGDYIHGCKKRPDFAGCMNCCSDTLPRGQTDANPNDVEACVGMCWQKWMTPRPETENDNPSAPPMTYTSCIKIFDSSNCGAADIPCDRCCNIRARAALGCIFGVHRAELESCPPQGEPGFLPCRNAKNREYRQKQKEIKDTERTCTKNCWRRADQ